MKKIRIWQAVFEKTSFIFLAAQGLAHADNCGSLKDCFSTVAAAASTIAAIATGTALLSWISGLFASTDFDLDPSPNPEDRVDDARGWLGTPYFYSGKNGSGIDCSGLVQQVYSDYFGDVGQGPAFHGARNASSQLQLLRDNGDAGISLDKLEPGDIVYFHDAVPNHVSHAGIVEMVGPDSSVGIIAASPGGKRVIEQPLRSDGSLDDQTQFLDAGRPTLDTDGEDQ